MKEIEEIIRQVLTTKGVKIGIETALDLGEGWIVPKSTVKMLKRKKRGCHKKYDTENRIYCIDCDFHLGSEECKSFKEQNNMKYKLFPSFPEEIGKYYGET